MIKWARRLVSYLSLPSSLPPSTTLLFRVAVTRFPLFFCSLLACCEALTAVALYCRVAALWIDCLCCEVCVVAVWSMAAVLFIVDS